MKRRYDAGYFKHHPDYGEIVGGLLEAVVPACIELDLRGPVLAGTGN